MEILLTIVGLSVVILIHEFGHFAAAKMSGVSVHEFGLGFPPKLFSFKYSGTVYSFNLIPLGGFVRMEGEDSLEEDDGAKPNSKSFAVKPVHTKIFILLAGIFMNIVLGFIVTSIVFNVGVPERVLVASVVSGSPAELSGINEGDEILNIAYGQNVLSDLKSVSEVIDFVKNAGDESIALTLMRGESEIKLAVNGRSAPPPGQGSLGISLIEVGFPSASVFESIGLGFKETILTLKEIVVQFGRLIAGVFSHSDALSGVTGPIGIFKIALETSSLGILYALHFLGFISLNLAVFNLIPFPALDGGRVLFVLFEKVIGKSFSRKFQAGAHFAGFVLLMLVMVFVTFRDIGRFF